MFRFLVGVVVGFFAWRMFSGSSEKGEQLRERAREMRSNAERVAQRAADKAQGFARGTES